MSFFDTFLLAMEIAVLVFAGIVVLLVLTVIAVSRRTAHYERADRHLAVEWRAFLLGEAGEPPPAPESHRDQVTVLLLFNDLTLGFPEDDDDAAARVTAVVAAARRAELDHLAGALLGGDDIARIVALLALARLGRATSADTARELLAEPGTEVSRAAARCLLLLEPGALGLVLDQVRLRPDWGASRVAAMLDEVDPRRVEAGLAPAISRAIEAGDVGGAVYLLSFLSSCTPSGARAICRSMLSSTPHPDVTAAALRELACVADADDILIARRFVGDGEPHVRLGAVRVLRAVGTAEDLALLRPLVADPDFWVRRRAAEVLVAIGGVAPGAPGSGDFAGIDDAYGRDALAEAVAGTRFSGPLVADSGQRRPVTAEPRVIGRP